MQSVLPAVGALVSGAAAGFFIAKSSYQTEIQQLEVTVQKLQTVPPVAAPLQSAPAAVDNSAAHTANRELEVLVAKLQAELQQERLRCANIQAQESQTRVSTR